MQLINIGHKFDYETEKVLRIFFPFEKINILHEYSENDDTVICEIINGSKVKVSANVLGKEETESEDLTSLDDSELALARCLYRCISKITGYKSDWGILTGIRPAKLFSSITDKSGIDTAKQIFKNEFLVSDKKTELCKVTSKSEKCITDLSRPQSFSLYVSVPFCPSRCSYCSFVSHSVESAKGIIPEYLRLLGKELVETGKIAKELGLRLETVYIGGGTPTSITADQLRELLFSVRANFDFSFVREFTVEAGRPDTIDREKLEVIKSAGVTRISINPQSMNDRVLEIIGRRHTAKATEEAFLLAREVGFNNINTDIIAGLDGDTEESFKNTVNRIISLCPESVTVHSLSVKRAANITRKGELPDINRGITARAMVDFAREALEQNGFLPYYMYRQSKTVGNLENVGYAKKGFEGLYNVYIMDETHTILACGASAVTKLKEPNGNNIERIFNFKYPYEYISRFSEIIERKDGVRAYYLKNKIWRI